MNFASWNVRTMLDNNSRPERRTALVVRMLGKYNIDVTALSETRLSGESNLEEVGAGYTFYWIGKPEGEPRTGGVGFAVHTPIARGLDKLPKAISERLITIRISLSKDRHATIISAYAPTMTHTDESFYEDLDRAIREAPRNDKLIILGDFNARVGCESDMWRKVIGKHGIGKTNSNGQLLLAKCNEHGLTITNTIFQQPNKYKTTWMHPRSKQWHMLDYVIVRQRDFRDVMLTRAMRGAECWSDHRLVRSKMSLHITPKKQIRREKPPRKLNVTGIKETSTQVKLQQKLQEATLPNDTECTDIEAAWRELRDATYSASAEVLGFVKRKNQDWFDENDEEISELLQRMHNTHSSFIANKTSAAKKSQYLHAKHVLQTRL